jgi:hypothetical protein
MFIDECALPVCGPVSEPIPFPSELSITHIFASVCGAKRDDATLGYSSPPPQWAHKGRYVSDTTLTLVSFSLSQRERGRKTSPRKPSMGEGWWG